MLCKRNRALQGPPPNRRAHCRPSHTYRRRVGNVDWGKGRADLRQLITAYMGPNYPPFTLFYLPSLCSSSHHSVLPPITLFCFPFNPFTMFYLPFTLFYLPSLCSNSIYFAVPPFTLLYLPSLCSSSHQSVLPPFHNVLPSLHSLLPSPHSVLPSLHCFNFFSLCSTATNFVLPPFTLIYLPSHSGVPSSNIYSFNSLHIISPSEYITVTLIFTIYHYV